ncbi:MAG: short-chain Z-isoprenyl diphosphate synthase, partial [Mycobacteriales bacterium]
MYGLYERLLRRQLAGRPGPRHVGVILDGNRRWARASGADVAHGHRRGAAKISDLLDWCAEARVEVVTLWLLSTDNLSRPPGELTPLLEIIEGVVEDLAQPHQPWQISVVGALDLLPPETAQLLKAAAERTTGRSGPVVNVAVGYGGRRAGQVVCREQPQRDHLDPCLGAPVEQVGDLRGPAPVTVRDVGPGRAGPPAVAVEDHTDVPRPGPSFQLPAQQTLVQPVHKITEGHASTAYAYHPT